MVSSLKYKFEDGPGGLIRDFDKNQYVILTDVVHTSMTSGDWLTFSCSVVPRFVFLLMDDITIFIVCLDLKHPGFI